ncbi:MAG: glycoside hydrolase family 3 C-terminal domain-containing protein, partial [Bacilli bacterium]|nr:glycoside hydrolase family 3 C-terminal domain-containing protein [Bacilli bacterium]
MNLHVYAGIGEIEIAGQQIGTWDWWVALVVLGVAVFLITLLYFLFAFLPGYAGKEEKGKKGHKIITRIVSPIVGFFALVGMLGGPVLKSNWSNVWMAITGNAGIGAIDNESSKLAAAEAEENIVQIEKEGAVLLRNENNCLPLQDNKKVNLFGAGVYGMFYGNGGSGAVQTTYRPQSAHPDRKVVKLEEAMEAEGFEINPHLFNLVKNYFPATAGNTDTSNSDRPSRTPYSIAPSDNKIECGVNTYAYKEIVRTCLPYNHEPEVSAYTQTYSQIESGKTLLEDAKDFSDTAIFCISRYGTEDSDMNTSELTIKPTEKAVISMLRENFDKVIILLNVSHAMEIGDLEEMGVDAIMLIGQPGLTGNTAIAKIIGGDYNPSGKLSDTWAYSAKSAPSYQSMGNDTTQKYTNSNEKFVEYVEGIYVGYRYYVTRGMTDSNFDYEDEVQYSFGYGKSYTTFEKWIAKQEVNKDTGKCSVTVSVKNTGNVTGKDVIELYDHAPYTERIEKSYYNLLSFKKTNEIAPGETKNYELEFTLRDMASWDTEKGYYVLEEGEYEISLRDDAWHQSVSQGHTTAFKFNLPLTEYKTSYQTGTEYSKQFVEAELGPSTTPIQYLKREDWTGTWTSANDLKSVALDSRHNEQLNIHNKNWGDNNLSDLQAPATDQKNNLTLRDLKDADWDDARWEDLLDELSINDLENLVEHGGFQTAEIKSIGKAKAVDYDGPAAAFHSGSGHPCGVIVASTWNIDAAVLFGESIGKEGAASGLTGWYAPGLTIHRSPYGERNIENYTEDPLISGMMAGYA